MICWILLIATCDHLEFTFLNPAIVSKCRMSFCIASSSSYYTSGEAFFGFSLQEVPRAPYLHTDCTL